MVQAYCCLFENAFCSGFPETIYVEALTGYSEYREISYNPKPGYIFITKVINLIHSIMLI